MIKQNPSTDIEKHHVTSKDKLSSVLIFLLNYPGQYIPVCDDGKLTGAVDKLKLKGLSQRKLQDFSIQKIKEDAPFIVLDTSSDFEVEREMRQKRIERVFIIDNKYHFKGVHAVTLPARTKKSVSIFDKLFASSLENAREA